MLKFAFEYLTSSFSLLENPIYDYVIMAGVGFIAFLIAYVVVGWFYNMDIIYGSSGGHILHWIIRLIVFVIVYYTIATIFKICKWFATLTIYDWIIIVLSIVGVAILRVSIKYV